MKKMQQVATNSKPTPPPQMGQGEREEAAAYLRRLLSGEVKAENRYVKDAVEQLRLADQELRGLKERADQLEVDLEQAKTRRIALVGIAQQLSMNLVAWREDKEEAG